MVPTRAESAASTRAALLRAASELLDEGGPEAVTVRAVGARAGVSRGAPYGHFADKEGLLAQLATDAWLAVTAGLEHLQADGRLSPSTRLERALRTLIGLSRERPHLYALMFGPAVGASPAALEVVGRSHDRFLEIVGAIVGPGDARRYGALLMAGAHGIASMELSGHLSEAKWGTTGDELVATLVASLPAS